MRLANFYHKRCWLNFEQIFRSHSAGLVDLLIAVSRLDGMSLWEGFSDSIHQLVSTLSLCIRSTWTRTGIPTQRPQVQCVTVHSHPSSLICCHSLSQPNSFISHYSQQSNRMIDCTRLSRMKSGERESNRMMSGEVASNRMKSIEFESNRMKPD